MAARRKQTHWLFGTVWCCSYGACTCWLFGTVWIIQTAFFVVCTVLRYVGDGTISVRHKQPHVAQSTTLHRTLRPRQCSLCFTERQYKPHDRGTFTVRRDEPPAVIVDRGTTAVNTTTTTPSQPTFLLVREHTLPRRNQRYGGIKDITVRHRTMINDCRFLPSSWVWEASTSIHSRSLCCVPVRCYVTRFGIHYRHNLYGTWYTY